MKFVDTVRPSRKRDYANLLIVEGPDDRHSVTGLMKHHLDWPDQEPYPVWVEVGESAAQILAQSHLSAELKAANVRRLGVMLDADENMAGRFERVKQLCSKLFPDFPSEMPRGGLVLEREDRRFGLWIMPDNSGPGGLETFLRHLVPDVQIRLWEHACESVEKALNLGASCRDSHKAKANLYTWLAWQDPPGQSPGLALTRKVLDPRGKHAEMFVTWFRELFGL